MEPDETCNTCTPSGNTRHKESSDKSMKQQRGTAGQFLFIFVCGFVQVAALPFRAPQSADRTAVVIWEKVRILLKANVVSKHTVRRLHLLGEFWNYIRVAVKELKVSCTLLFCVRQLNAHLFSASFNVSQEIACCQPLIQWLTGWFNFSIERKRSALFSEWNLLIKVFRTFSLCWIYFTG